MGTNRGRTNTAVRGTTWPDVELDAGQLVVLDDQAGDRLVDDADGAGDELLALVGGERRCRWRRTRRRRTTGGRGGRGRSSLRGVPPEDAEGLVADLVAVAVRAVQQVTTPPFADAGDVGEFVAQAGGHQDAAGAQRAAVLEGDLERRRVAAGAGRGAMPVTVPATSWPP